MLAPNSKFAMDFFFPARLHKLVLVNFVIGFFGPAPMCKWVCSQFFPWGLCTSAIHKWVVVNFAMGFFFLLPICRNGLLLSFAMSFLSCPYPEMGCNKFCNGFFFYNPYPLCEKRVEVHREGIIE